MKSRFRKEPFHGDPRKTRSCNRKIHSAARLLLAGAAAALAERAGKAHRLGKEHDPRSAGLDARLRRCRAESRGRKISSGLSPFRAGQRRQPDWDVPNLCRPHLQHLVDCFNESVYLARLSGDDLLLAICEEPHTSFRITSEAGTRLPLHCSSQGKAILPTARATRPSVCCAVRRSRS